ncbi:MAG: PatB family C-S lyase [Marinilabiliales bacterium]|nr:PatB family C-S lyase [Marinilabiliales bacterium]
MGKYNFDEIIPRRGTDCEKYDLLGAYFGNADAIPLWVADGDFRVPDFITAAIRKRVDHEIYAYSYRPEGYYQSIVNWQKLRHNWEVQKEMILPTEGVVLTLSALIMAFTEPGDQVVIQPPVYTPFFTCVRQTGREVVENPLKRTGDHYTFDLDDLKEKISSRTKMLILCNPHNPVGRVWTEAELLELGRICVEHNILMVSDEIHSDLVFGGYRHIPFPTLSKELADRCIVCMAPSKTFNIAGLSSSYVIIPDPAIRGQFDRFLHQLHLVNGNIIGNVALEAAYTHGSEWVDEQNDYLAENRNYLLDVLSKRMPRVRMTFTEATYLAWMDFSAYGLSEKELNHRLIHQAGIVLNKGSIYGKEGDGFFRLNFACPRSVLATALEKMAGELGR